MFRLSESPGSIRFTGRRLGQDNEQVYARAARPRIRPDRRATEQRSDLMHRSYLFAPGHNDKLLGARVRGRRGRGDARPRGRRSAGRQGSRPARWSPAFSPTARPGCASTRSAPTWPPPTSTPSPGSPPGSGSPRSSPPTTCSGSRDRAPDTPLICAIESARGSLAAPEIAAAPGVRHLSMGGVDLRRDLGAGDGNLQTLYARSHLVVASRAAGLGPPIDSVYAAPRRRRRGCASRPSSPARSASSASPRSIHGSSRTIHDVFTPSARRADLGADRARRLRRRRRQRGQAAGR